MIAPLALSVETFKLLVVKVDVVTLLNIPVVEVMVDDCKYVIVPVVDTKVLTFAEVNTPVDAVMIPELITPEVMTPEVMTLELIPVAYKLANIPVDAIMVEDCKDAIDPVVATKVAAVTFAALIPVALNEEKIPVAAVTFVDVTFVDVTFVELTLVALSVPTVRLLKEPLVATTGPMMLDAMIVPNTPVAVGANTLPDCASSVNVVCPIAFVNNIWLLAPSSCIWSPTYKSPA